MPLSKLLSILVHHPNITEGLSPASFFEFFWIVGHLREHLSWHRAPDIEGPLLMLPKKICTFCAAALGVEDQGLIIKCWMTLHDITWGTVVGGDTQRNGDLVDVFLRHGIKYSIGTFICF